MNAIRTMMPLAALPGNRATSVGLAARAVSSAFGLPSFVRANGLSESGRLSRVAARLRRRRKGSVPVFQVDRRGQRGDEKLPRIWVSEPDCAADGMQASGRRLYASYPCGPDAGGTRALKMAERLYGEGQVAKDASVAIACFQAAEILYLHAAQRGSVEALCRLGVLYQADLCEGQYWRDTISAHAKHAREDVARKAVRMFSRAAARGHAEAKWRLGDMRAAGCGCEPAITLAWNLYRGAFCRAADCTMEALDAAKGVDEVLALVTGKRTHLEDCGCAALRLATCLEQGCGCPYDPTQALVWYTAAVRLLDSCVDSGAWLYQEELAAAESSAVRLRDARTDAADTEDAPPKDAVFMGAAASNGIPHDERLELTW